MANNITSNIISEYSYLQIFLSVLTYFICLYFILGPLFHIACKRLNAIGLLKKISDVSLSKSQIIFEIKHSSISIIIFGLSAIPIVFMIRNGHITLAENTLTNTIIGLCVLTVWNEIHFFLVHRIMHFPYFMRKVHFIHHQSKVPSVYSVYSFHWFEAALLSTVPLTILPFIRLAPFAIMLYPLISILLNFAGHCNYRFGRGNGPGWTRFGTKHHAHHHEFLPQYGFASGLLDRLYQKTISKTNQPKK